jgi:hypothetical protein
MGCRRCAKAADGERDDRRAAVGFVHFRESTLSKAGPAANAFVSPWARGPGRGSPPWRMTPARPAARSSSLFRQETGWPLLTLRRAYRDADDLSEARRPSLLAADPCDDGRMASVMIVDRLQVRRSPRKGQQCSPNGTGTVRQASSFPWAHTRTQGNCFPWVRRQDGSARLGECPTRVGPCDPLLLLYFAKTGCPSWRCACPIGMRMTPRRHRVPWLHACRPCAPATPTVADGAGGADCMLGRDAGPGRGSPF